MGAEHWDEQVGSVADEATRLLQSLRRSAADAAAGERPASPEVPADAGGAPPAGTRTGPGSTDAAGDGEGDGATASSAASGAGVHDPFCPWCPLCRGAAAVRTLSPETLTRLADLAGVAATVLADLASTRSTAAADGGTPEDGRPGPDRSASSRPIPVHDADDPEEAPRG